MNILTRDFSTKTIRALAKNGITIIGKTYLPGDGDLPYANGETGYQLNDNGTGRVRTHAQVMGMAQ